jgi:DNA sulfur modification protein DndC
MNDRLVHGPYTQERRAELLRELLKTQLTVQRAVPDWGEKGLELIQLEELQEIRRQWVVEKGEIEDLAGCGNTQQPSPRPSGVMRYQRSTSTT